MNLLPKQQSKINKKDGSFDYSFPQEIFANEETVCTVKFESNTLINKARFKFDTINFPEEGTVTYKMTDSLGHEFTFENSGFWGSEEGFKIPEEYSATTEVKLVFSKEGDYEVSVELVNVESQETVMSSTTLVNVLAEKNN